MITIADGSPVQVPRTVSSLPEGTVFRGDDGDVWLVVSWYSREGMPAYVIRIRDSKLFPTVSDTCPVKVTRIIYPNALLTLRSGETT